MGDDRTAAAALFGMPFHLGGRIDAVSNRMDGVTGRLGGRADALSTGVRDVLGEMRGRPDAWMP